jgi:hypothetical protein
MSWVVNTTLRPLYPPGRDAVPIVQEVGGPRGLVWTGRENLAGTGFRTAARLARSEALYHLRYTTRHINIALCNKGAD